MNKMYYVSVPLFLISLSTGVFEQLSMFDGPLDLLFSKLTMCILPMFYEIVCVVLLSFQELPIKDGINSFGILAEDIFQICDLPTICTLFYIGLSQHVDTLHQFDIFTLSI